MKKLILACLVVATALSGRAQLFSEEAMTGALFGGLIGGIAGGGSSKSCYNGCYYQSGFSSSDAAIGAGIGLVVGAIAGEARRQNEYNSQSYVYQPAPVATPGYGYTSPYVYYAPNNYSAPAYYYRPQRPNYAVGGTLVGAASGALIGQGTGNAGEGAAIGAGAGLVLGAIAEHTARKQQQKASSQVQYVSVPQPNPSERESPQHPDTPAQSQITSTPAPNSTYYWTAPPRQIPDAPRVPDAPTF